MSTLRFQRVFLTAGFAVAVASPFASASLWVGTPGVWSSDGNPGWNGSGVPNAMAAVAEYAGGTSVLSTTQDIGAGVTVGTIRSSGTGNASWTIIPTNPITLNQDGGGSGSAVIESTRSTAGGHRLNINAGTFTLADNLIIRNNSASNSASGGLNLAMNLGGTGNVTYENLNSNNPAVNQIALNNGSNTSNFTGNVLVRKGAVAFNDKDFFGNQATNVLTLGESGQGSATLVSTTAVGTVVNNIVVASGTGGTSLLGTTSTATSNNTTYSGTVLLNGDLSFTSGQTGTGYASLSNTVSGAGSITKLGAGIARLSGVNTYTGNTIVSAGTLNLISGGETRFVIQDGDVSNSISGTGAIDLGGVLRLDISGLTVTEGTWNLVNVGTLTETWGGSFGVAFVGGPAFTPAGGGDFVNGDWTFSQTAGTLTLVPEPASLALLSAGAMMLFTRRRTTR